MKILVCIKRTPDISEQITLNAEGTGLDESGLGHQMSTHEECAVELAVQLSSAHDGSVTVLTLGTEDALEQLRSALAVGCDDAILVEAGDPAAYGPEDTARAIAAAVREREAEDGPFDLIFTGTDAADTGDFQVGVRLAYELGRPALGSITTITAAGDGFEARGTSPAGTAVYALPMPAVVAVQEGGVSPRYPSITGRMKAKRAPVDELEALPPEQGSPRVRLELPPETADEVTILGHGPDACPQLVDVLEEIGVMSR